MLKKKSERSKSISAAANDTKEYFSVLKSFINHLSLISTSSFGLLTTIQSIEKSVQVMLSESPKRAIPVYKQAREINENLTNFSESLSKKIKLAKELDSQQLIKDEHAKILNAIQKLAEHPPTTSKSKRESKAAAKEIFGTLDDIFESIKNNDKEAAKNKLNDLKKDFLHKYESFFRLSQIPKQEKSILPDACRFSVDRIVALLDYDAESLSIPEEMLLLQDLLTEMSKKPESSRSPSSLSKGSAHENEVPKQQETKMKHARSRSQPSFPKTSLKPNIFSSQVRKAPAVPKLTSVQKRKTSEPLTPEKQIAKKPSVAPTASSSAKKSPSYIPKLVTTKEAKNHDQPSKKTTSKDKTFVPLAQSISTLPKASAASSKSAKKSDASKASKQEKSVPSVNENKQKNVIKAMKDAIETLHKASEKLKGYVSAKKANEQLDQCAEIFALMKKRNANGKQIGGKLLQLNSLISEVEESVPKKPQLDMKIAEAAQSVADLNNVIQFGGFDDTTSIEQVSKRIQKLGGDPTLAVAGPIGFVDISDHYQALQESYDEMKKEMEQEESKRIENNQKEEQRTKYLNRLINNHKRVAKLIGNCKNEEFCEIFNRQKSILARLEDIN